jgi:cyclomaltodextrinase
MLLEAVYHRPKLNWSYAYDRDTIHLRLRTKRNDVDQVFALTSDKYNFTETKRLLPMERFAWDERFDYWQVAVKPPFRRLQYAFMLQAGETSIWLSEKGFSHAEPDAAYGLFEYPYLNVADLFEPPSWVKDAVFYQIFPERFANGDPANDPPGTEAWGGKPRPDNFFGGDLKGVLERLDYLSELGITAIYFTPIFAAPTNHKHDTHDYMKVDPHFGDNELLKTLVRACHERGIRVLLDAVFNHCGRTFPPFVDVLEKGEASRYKDWFHVREFPLDVKDGIPTYDTFAFVPTMPKLNTEHPEVKEYLLNVARYWIEEVGIDGWRLDVANEVDHQFWREFRRVVKAAKPDAYILGEIWHDALMWLQGDQFDAVMNYPFTNAVLDFFCRRSIDAEQFSHRIGALMAQYPLQVHEAAFNLLGSHDTERILTVCNGDKRLVQMATAFQFTFPGVPCIYYGDEIGLDGGHDPDCRKCMVWDEAGQDRQMFTFFQRMIALRKKHSALRTGTFRFVKAEGSLVAYERRDEHERFVIAANVGGHPCSLELPLAEGRRWIEQPLGMWGGTENENENENVSSAIVSLPPFSLRIWRLE